MNRETVVTQHSNITSGDMTRAMGIDFIPGRSSTECLPRKIAYPHTRWGNRWKRYRKEVASGTFGAKWSKGQMNEATWEEINKA